LAGEASANCELPDAALPQLPIAMFITNPLQIPLAASREPGERRELIQELLNYRID
jgi:hypothetical protein